MANFDDMKLAVEALTGGKNTVILDDMDMPSIMVRWEKQKIKDIMTGGTDRIHPGSIVNGVEKIMYVGKYQSIVVNDRAYSLPFQDPRANINFDTAVTVNRNKKTDGMSWGLIPYALWCEIALWCRKNDTMPRGNNNYGRDHAYPHEVGIPSMALDSSGRVQRCATGSGPATWNHNWLPDGICDLNGNVWEWCAGMRMLDGEFQFIPNANCMDPEVSMSATSTLWKALNADGEFVDPGSAGTLKYDWLNSKLTLTKGDVTDTEGDVTDTEGTGRSTGYKDIALASDLTAPEMAKALLLCPDEPGGDYAGDNHYATLAGERLPYCGGRWYNTSSAGVFYVSLSDARSYSGGHIGFRSACCELNN